MRSAKLVSPIVNQAREGLVWMRRVWMCSNGDSQQAARETRSKGKKGLMGGQLEFIPRMRVALL